MAMTRLGELPIDRYLINSPMLPARKEERRRVRHDLHSKRVAGRGQGSQLAAGAGPVYLAMRLYRPKMEPSFVLPRRGNLETAGHREGWLKKQTPDRDRTGGDIRWWIV